MAVVTITIKDEESGGVTIQAGCDVDVPENDDDATHAMRVGAFMVKLTDTIIHDVAAQVMEGSGE